MPNENIPPGKVREIRDLMLLYLYQEGGSGPSKQEIPIEQLKKALGLSQPEYLAGYHNLQSRRLLKWPPTVNYIGISVDGQFEVETLGTLDNGIDGQTTSMVAEIRKISKQMAEHSAAREEIEARFEAYRSRPWWRRIAG
jgi:hypothetical protein